MEIGSQTFCHMSIADNLLLAPSAEYTNFALWDLRTQTKIREFKNQSYADACCSNDSEESKNRGMVTSLHLWYPTSASSASASFSPSSINRPMALAGWEDGTLQLWDILEDRLLDEQKPHSEPGEKSNNIIPYIVADAVYAIVLLRQLKFSNFGSFSLVVVFACHARGNLCMSGGAPSSLSFVNIDSAAGNKFHQESTFTLPNPGISEICIRNDGKLCAVAGWDHRIRLFSGKSRAPLAILKHHTSNVTCLDFAQAPGNPSGVPAGPAWLMAAGSKDTEISIWNLYPPSLSSVSASSSSSSPPP